MKWWCCDGNNQKSTKDKSDTESLVSLYEDLNIYDLEADDPSIKQVCSSFIIYEQNDYLTYL